MQNSMGMFTFLGFGLKSFAVKKKNVIRTTTRFMSGKLLMFAKLSLKSFIYEFSQILSFPDEIVKEI